MNFQFSNLLIDNKDNMITLQREARRVEFTNLVNKKVNIFQGILLNKIEIESYKGGNNIINISPKWINKYNLYNHLNSYEERLELFNSCLDYLLSIEVIRHGEGSFFMINPAINFTCYSKEILHVWISLAL